MGIITEDLSTLRARILCISNSKKMPPKQIPNKKRRTQEYKQRVKANLVRVLRYDGLVKCHVPKTGVTIRTNRHGRLSYCISINNHDISCQRLSYLVNRGNVTGSSKVYHICGNVSCCKPSHLVVEKHSYNASRFNCPGYVRIKGTDKLLKVCPHSPPCIKVTDQDSLDTVDPKDVDPGLAVDKESDIKKEEVESQDPEESEEEVEEEIEEDDSESSEEEEEPVSWKFKLRPRK